MKAKFPVLLAALACCLAAPAAFAGSNNVLYLIQDSNPAPGAPNSFTSDQTTAIGSTIGDPALFKPALQEGHGNIANLAIQCLVSPCLGGSISLLQNNAAGGSASSAGNTASVLVTGGGAASVSQQGSGNIAHLSLYDGLGSIEQNGDGNTAKLQLEPGVSGAVNQNGNGNYADLLVYGTPQSSVSLTQNGSQAAYGNISTVPFVVSTSGQVTITQTTAF